MRYYLIILLSAINLVTFGQTATYLSNFEDQTWQADIGTASREMSSFSGTYTGWMEVTLNPAPDANNNSSYVLRHVLKNDGLQRRSEYTCSRIETLDKKYIYTWSIYQPENSYVDVNLTYMAFNQFKTWPCEAGPISNPDYQHFDTLICSGGGIFNDMFYYPDDEIVEYRVRARPNCNYERVPMDLGRWHRFVLEVFWTDSTDGYYRIWKNDTLYGYSENIRTIPEEFVEGTCNMYWSNGMYSSWFQSGDMTTDSIESYTDNIAIFDIDSGYTVSDVCPDCELPVPSVQTDSLWYRVNINGSSNSEYGFNNYIVSWSGYTYARNLSSFDYGQSTGIDLYLWTDETAINNTLTDFSCFPENVLESAIQWEDTTTNQIILRDLTPENTYTFKVLSATGDGLQIWTTNENRDSIIISGSNVCDMATLTGLKSDETGYLEINVKTISDVTPTLRINAIELIEYPNFDTTYCDTVTFSAYASITDATTNDGAIDQTVLSPQSVTHSWSNGENTEDLTGLVAGNYTDTITMVDSLCTLLKIYTVDQLALPISSISINARRLNANKIKVGQ